MTITFTAASSPRDKVADVILVFEDHCDLGGLQLQGFAIWRRGSDLTLYVVFPGRTYQVNGERRTFTLLRPAAGSSGQAKQQLEDRILRAYAVWLAREEELQRKGDELTTHLASVARRLGVVPGGSTPSTS